MPSEFEALSAALTLTYDALEARAAHNPLLRAVLDRLGPDGVAVDPWDDSDALTNGTVEQLIR